MTTLNEWVQRIGEGNKKRGFHEFPNGGTQADVRNYWTTRIALAMTEGAEAIEELRDGNDVDYRYYKGAKPEGVPVEMIDMLIRALDFFYEIGWEDTEKLLEEKLAYNESRGVKHGRKF